jgi:cardiolipin synthase
VISRDIFILIGVAVLFINHKSFEIRPTLLGKVSTFFQLTTIVIALSVTQPLLALQPFLVGSVYLAGALTILSGFHYAFIWVRQMVE